MGLFDFLFGGNSSNNKTPFNFDEQCEDCEEFLEDCQPDCSGFHQSREDISAGFWDDDNDDRGGTSFDNFGG